MRRSALSLFILQCCGFWRPVEWSDWRKWIYNIYTAFMIFVIYSVVVSQFIELFNSVDSVQKFTHNALILLATANACAKAFNILNNKDDIFRLIRVLETDPCCFRDDDELIIQKKYNRSIENMSLWYTTLTVISVAAVEIDSIIHHPPRKQLQFNAWLPYTCDTEFKYWITYIHQAFATILGSFINISYDTLVPGCMLQTCAQLSIFKYRVKKLGLISKNNEVVYDEVKERQLEENRIIADCVYHHLQIFNFAGTANAIFAYTIFIQYNVSLIILCVSVCELTRIKPLTPEFMAVISYLACMLTQIFIFCFYGNIVMHKSYAVGDDIYKINWVSLTIQTKKSLLIIMARTLRPIIFTSGRVIILSLDSFTDILKLSYSAYNVLQQLSHPRNAGQ